MRCSCIYPSTSTLEQQVSVFKQQILLVQQYDPCNMEVQYVCVCKQHILLVKQYDLCNMEEQHMYVSKQHILLVQ